MSVEGNSFGVDQLGHRNAEGVDRNGHTDGAQSNISESDIGGQAHSNMPPLHCDVILDQLLSS